MGCLFSKHSSFPNSLEMPNSFPILSPSSSLYIPFIYKHPYSISTIIPSFSNFITCYTNTSPSAHYEFLQSLGTGASSTISKLKHKSSRLIRALKTICFSDKHHLQLQDILNEIKITSSLTHPNIMKVYEYYHNELSIDIVCEYLPDGDLFELLQKQQDKCFNEAITSIIMKQLFSAIKYCHDNGIVYRDMKLENIMIEKIDTYKVKLIDFGTAKKLNENEKCSQKIGSPHYVAPEIIKEELYDYKCDLWSLGVIMYNLLYGTKPFKGNNDDELYMNIKEGKVNYNENGITISNECKQLLMNLLQINQYERIDIDNALTSEWIIRNSKCNDNNILNEFIIKHNDIIISIKQNIETLHIQNKLQLAFLIYTINTLDIPLKEIISQLFNHLDTNGDGLLSKEELRSGISILYNNNNIQFIESLINKIFSIFTDINNAFPFINEDHFIICCIDRASLITSKTLQSSFMVIDSNKKGKITFESFSSFFNAKSDIITKIWNECNMDQKENEITYAKYSQIIKGIK